jgi:hypothetical protein
MKNCKSKHPNDLAERLSKGKHEVSFEDRVKEIYRVEERIEDSFCVREIHKDSWKNRIWHKSYLGKNVIFSNGDFRKGAEKLWVVGTCKFNYCRIKCVVDVDFGIREGTGRLELL